LACFGCALGSLAQSLPPGVLPCLTNAVPDNYGTFLFLRGTTYQQSAPTFTSEITPNGSFAWFQLQAAPSLVISNVVVAGPAAYRLELENLSEQTLEAFTDFPSRRDMDAWVQPGPWSARLDIRLPDSLPFLGFFRFNLSPRTPPIPRLDHFDALNSLDNSTNVVLTWNEWPDFSPNDRVYLEIREANGTVVFSTSTGCGGLTPLADGENSITLPAGTLAPARSYTGFLTFAASTFAALDPGALLIQRGTDSRTTRFSLRTTGTPVSDGVLSDPRLSATGANLIFTLRGTAGTTYFVQSSTNLSNWDVEHVTRLPISGVANVNLPLPSDGTSRFWRAVLSLGVETPPSLGIRRDPRFRDSLQLIIEGTRGGSYRVEVSTLSLGDWATLTPFNLNIPLNTNRITFGGVPFSRANRFTAFRVVSVPR